MKRTTFDPEPQIKALAAYFSGEVEYDRSMDGYSGPHVGWDYGGSHAATSPETRDALNPEYLQDNDIEVTNEYILWLAFRLGVEQGRRMTLDERRVDEGLGLTLKDYGHA